MSTLKIVMKQRMGTDELRNVFYVAGAFATTANSQAIGDYFRTAWVRAGNSIQAVLSTAWTMYGFDVKDVTDPLNPTVPFVFTSGDLVGLNGSSEPLPQQIAAMVSFKALTAPPNTSRKYLAGMTEGEHDANGWLASTKTRLGVWAQTFLDMPTDLDPGIALVVSRFNLNVLVGSNILDSYIVSDYARTQRRRTPGRGS